VIAGTPRHRLNARVLSTGLIAWVALGAVLVTVTSGEHTGLGIGWGLAGILSALSFGALLWVRSRSMQDLLLVVVGGFLFRMLVVGITLVLMLHAHADPMRFALGFFSAYLLLQVIEAYWVNAQARTARGVAE